MARVKPQGPPWRLESRRSSGAGACRGGSKHWTMSNFGWQCWIEDSLDVQGGQWQAGSGFVPNWRTLMLGRAEKVAQLHASRKLSSLSSSSSSPSSSRTKRFGLLLASAPGSGVFATRSEIDFRVQPLQPSHCRKSQKPP
ncbi:hypothetical protein G7Y89_g5565 [Cudoniella acicularis]|uniref:Uncharacterized protein n=1 Tax=Cudoniella acicularis TaxID=354080 RepID=A0A8H4RPE9_9HELO|nr:hypothetical protein G7Y89_g5565 [Cudoniella acicularis]